MAPPGEHRVTRRRVDCVVVRNRADDGHAIGPRCELGKHLTKVSARDAGRDWFELPTNLNGSVWFRVECVVLRCTTREKQENAPLCAAERSRCYFACAKRRSCSG